MFVPFVPVTPASGSPRAQELARRIVELIRTYRQQHPDTSALDVQGALRIARIEAGGGARLKAVLVVLVGLIALGGFFALRLFENGGGDGPFGGIALTGVILIAIVAIAVIVIKNQQ